MPPLRPLRALIAALLASLVLILPADAAIPSGFVGLQASSLPSAGELARIAAANVHTFRFVLDWSAVESCVGCRDWSAYDAFMANAARHHIRTLPVLLYSPAYYASQPDYPPETTAGRVAFASFVHEAVARYGSRGTFWASHPSLPRMPPLGWQVWNEPNIQDYWNGHPDPADYARLLESAAGAIRLADPHTKVVLAGVTNSPQYSITEFLRAFYRVRGVRRFFDVVAIHPYTFNQKGVLGEVRLTREVMAAHHDQAKPVWVTEIGWAAGGPPSLFEVPLAEQAQLLRRTFSLLSRHRRRLKIGEVMWYQLQDQPLPTGQLDWWGLHSGLFAVNGEAKTAWYMLAALTGGQAGMGPLD